MKSLLLQMSLLSTLSACTWINDADYKAELENVDEDGDGVTKAEGDCNDQMATVSPLLEETWYDGIDNDCAGGNDFDKDGDGFVPTEHQGKMTTSHVEVAPLPGGDCNDEDPLSYPGATDEWYDGVDSDCRGNDDYDKDGDEFVPDEYVGLTTLNIEGATALLGGDCNDDDASINPGEIDNWYDGVDSDCGGENDYDRDGDGVAYELIDANTNVGGLARGDCDDQNALIYPGQTETWYDGVDADCAEDDDYDQDKDGYVPTEYQGERTTGLHGTGNLPGGDCDDLNPDRYEGANEIMTDPADYDCDLCIAQDCSQTPELGGHSATINDSEYILYTTASHPENIRITSNETSIFVSSRTDDVITTNPINGTTINYYSASYVAAFDKLGLDLSPEEFFRWRGKTNDYDSDLYSDMQAVAANEEFFIGAIGQEKNDSSGNHLYRYLRLVTKRLGPTQFGQAAYIHSSSRTTGIAALMDDVSVMIDSNDVVHAVGCEATDGILQYIRIPLAAFQSSTNISLEVELEVPDMFFSGCKLSEDANGNGVLWANEGGILSPYTFSLSAAEADITFTQGIALPETHPTLSEWTTTDQGPDAVFVIADSQGVWARVDGVEYRISTQTNPRHAYGVMSESGELVVSIVSATGQGSILYGDPSTFTTVTPIMNSFQLTSPLALTEVAPYTYTDENGDEKIFIAFLGMAGVQPKMGFATLTR